jgi:hypothetical protein
MTTKENGVVFYMTYLLHLDRAEYWCVLFVIIEYD